MRTGPAAFPHGDAARAFAAWWKHRGGDFPRVAPGTLLAVWGAAWRQAQAALLAEAARRELGPGGSARPPRG